MAIIEIDKGSGFCFGVTTAIRKAEEELEQSGHLYCLGDIVHNTAEVDRLASQGLETITHEQLEQLHDVKVLLRAHGEPPETYETARRNRIEIIDATCPVVLKLQQRIHTTYHNDDQGAAALPPQIVIYGKRGHAEVLGLVGQTQGHATVIENIGEIDKIDYSRDIYLYSQTTKSVQEFQHIVEEIKRRIDPGVTFRSFDTICRSVANRIPQIREFAAQHELILFVSGAKSSNGRILFAECQAANADSHLISSEADIDPSWLEGKERIGICGATSTPRWLMQLVSEAVHRMTSNHHANS
ncbi:MAG: 4-hydroxy-3-methylbut-2-enyl diphosphate reductase [Muribaculaceae bacterium]|nr:4-hydroxy-3-methylbut-2-enyl diphosphate reductase [Muribaculaceae bacterium]